MTNELTPHPLAKWIKHAADGQVVLIKHFGTWDDWHSATLQALCSSIDQNEFSFKLAPPVPREWYMVMFLPDRRLMQASDSLAGAQEWLDESTTCPEKYEIYHVREVIE